MAEERVYTFTAGSRVTIEVCSSGFMVVGGKYGGEEVRAFSTPEGLIEWLSRELGAGPIVWSLTLDVWHEEAGIASEDLLPVPDAGLDPSGYQKAIEDNAKFILDHFVKVGLRMRADEVPPEPQPKKAKKPKEEKPKEEVKGR